MIKDRHGFWTNVSPLFDKSQVSDGTYFIAYNPTTVQTVNPNNEYRLVICAINGVSFTATIDVAFIF